MARVSQAPGFIGHELNTTGYDIPIISAKKGGGVTGARPPTDYVPTATTTSTPKFRKFAQRAGVVVIVCIVLIAMLAL
ncbi:hypothetical protein Daesc_005661 [Daldinia eschscholtzii]|uniref:Uncharacterized protein n=1 Tax=Daldinia eschscholtzii TaxID=292717 RepID=A0AAX6ML34_9PEZI